MTQAYLNRKILLVDDNVRITTELSNIFESAGYATSTALDSFEARDLISNQIFDLVVLDLNLPGEDGLSICKWLRALYPDIGIVVLTARVMGGDRADGYIAGADVYLTKPTRPAELLAVAGNLVERIQRSGENIAPSESTWTLNITEMYLISPKAEAVSLTPKESIFLKILAGSADTCHHIEILDGLGVDSSKSGEKAKLEVLVSRLRQKLSRLQPQGLEIRTVVGTGYRLMTPLLIRSAAAPTPRQLPRK